jgi:hypothetical protein
MRMKRYKLHSNNQALEDDGSLNHDGQYFTLVTELCHTGIHRAIINHKDR